ncbi:aldehyde dehydrogenase family protein [Modestobacter sp. VKM Ac-2978]|uniref:aldehyde dehydrogenase family protein n=1 Tax=Modestobacter sp. VKM Ac-2978 TaxID=3004132 RepID=UPI0022AB3AF6|nr:aldehyde dehydrogenase family protein [Modestobacter sp. VKM Ac-2978]MCZ2849903.1 aldehyde dehydrogenase family protein [Modestobacter sp. VKM Ac-2978]
MITELQLPPTQHYIEGAWRASADGGVFDVENPATGAPLATLSAGTATDVDAAVRAARDAFERGPWSQMSGADRGRLLWRLADLVERDREILATLEASDVGRPYVESFMFEIPLVADTFRHFAGWADKVTGTTFGLPPFAGQERFSYTLRQPLGVVGAITPWNAPTMILAWKLAPALAVGNTVVVKPAELASLTTLYIAALVAEAGFPPGVVNVVTGSGQVAGEALVRHAEVDKISFTGSTAVGRHIAAVAGEQLKKVTLELGGKSPQIIRGDADLNAALPVIATAVFANQGQTCASGSRILVHRSRVGAVAQGLADIAQSAVVGDPFDEGTTMGSLISSAQLDRVLGYVERGLAEGAHLVTGGRRIGTTGYFVEPTVFVGDNDLTIAREEIFGPVGTIIPFDDDEEALRLANDTEYGLTAVLWTGDASAVTRFTRQLKTGSVWVNAWGPPHPALPWSGQRASGIGEELGMAGLLANTIEKTVNLVSRG